MSFGATFLRRPECFPAALEGEPWGEHELTLTLPGGPYRFTGLSAAQRQSALATFPGWAAAPDAAGTTGSTGSTGSAGAAVAVAVRRRAAGDFLPVDVRGWDYALDFDCQPAALRLAGLGLLGRLDWRPALAAALWTPVDGGELFPGVFENFFRVLVAYRLLDLGGVILHSAGVVKDGAAFLFLGRSGAGKTTVSRLSLARGAEVLSDDLNALCPDAAAGCLVHKLPFTGDLGERRGVRRPVPLAALLRLEQDTRDALLPLSRAETLACMLACAPFANVDPCRRERLEAALLALLAAAAPAAYALRFSLGGGFWSILTTK
jgi:hypothetical protein